MKKFLSLLFVFLLITSNLSAGTLEMDWMEGCSTNALAQAAYVSNAAEAIVQEYPSGQDAATNINGETGAAERVAESFQHNANFSCSKVSVYIQKAGSPTDNIIADIQTDSSGLPSGTLVDANATKAIDASTIDTSYTFVDFTFPASITLTANTQYHLVLRRSGSNDETNRIQWGTDSSTPTYANGIWERRNSGTWITNADIDFLFKIYSSNYLQSYSGSGTGYITQGTYSLKVVATTDANGKTLTKTAAIGNLTGVKNLKFDIRASRTGANIKLGIVDAGATTEITPTIITADTFQTVNWNISAVSDANKDAITNLVITITNADVANTFYIDYYEIAQAIDVFGWAN